MPLILHDKRCCPVKVSNAGKIHTMLRFVDARFAFVSFILHGQRTHNKITPQVDLSLVFQGLEVCLEYSRRT